MVSIIYGDHTHSADYSPQNMNTDWLTALCGEIFRATEYSGTPTCGKCKVALLKAKLKKQREVIHAHN